MGVLYRGPFGTIYLIQNALFSPSNSALETGATERMNSIKVSQHPAHTQIHTHKHSHTNTHTNKHSHRHTHTTYKHRDTYAHMHKHRLITQNKFPDYRLAAIRSSFLRIGIFKS
jgi:ABC-type nickel/cobalt efflux system permease component RcnA